MLTISVQFNLYAMNICFFLMDWIWFCFKAHNAHVHN